MLALQPIHQYLEQLLAYTHAYTKTTRVQATTQTPTVSRLWLELSFLPVNIICSVLDDPEPIGTDGPTRYADHEWLLNNLPAIESECTDEPVNVIDLVKARERRQLIAERQKRYDHSKGQHLHPRSRAVVEALIAADFIYINGYENEDLHGVRIGGFGVSEEFEGGYWIAVQHLLSKEVWGFDASANCPMTIMETVDIIGDAIRQWDTKDQLPLPLPDPEPAQPEPPTVPADYIPPIPEDAFIVMGAKGSFAVKEIDGGYLIGRWVTQKAGLKFSRHLIPDDGNCDCKASQAGKNCCHQKALDHYQYQQKEQTRIESEREQERLRMLEKNRYELVTVDADGNEKTRNFERDIYSAQFHWDLSQKNASIISAIIQDRLLDKTIAKWRRPMIAAS